MNSTKKWTSYLLHFFVSPSDTSQATVQNIVAYGAGQGRAERHTKSQDRVMQNIKLLKYIHPSSQPIQCPWHVYVVSQCIQPANTPHLYSSFSYCTHTHTIHRQHNAVGIRILFGPSAIWASFSSWESFWIKWLRLQREKSLLPSICVCRNIKAPT